MISYDEFSRAARDNDAVALENAGNGIGAVCDTLDVHPASLVRAAEQRAMRMVIVERGPDEQARLRRQNYANEFSREDFSDDEIEKLIRYQAVWIDAVLTGIRAAWDEVIIQGYTKGGS